MEKYAVDLEKVLDDFEYSEKQLHEYSPEQRTINESFNCNYKINDIFNRPYRPPASSYRRPPFEPMNLADADFSVSIKPPSNAQIQPSVLNASHSDSSQNIEIASTTNVMKPFNPEQPSVSTNYPFMSNSKDKIDFKPDLIESNTEVHSSSDELHHIERNLPDIASADKGFNESKIPENYDVDNLGNENDMPSKEEPNPPKVVSFQLFDGADDRYLTSYLEELVESEKLAELAENAAEQGVEITEDCSYVHEGDKNEYSSSDNYDASKSSCSSESRNLDYHVLSDSVLLISGATSPEYLDNSEAKTDNIDGGVIKSDTTTEQSFSEDKTDSCVDDPLPLESDCEISIANSGNEEDENKEIIDSVVDEEFPSEHKDHNQCEEVIENTVNDDEELPQKNNDIEKELVSKLNLGLDKTSVNIEVEQSCIEIPPHTKECVAEKIIEDIPRMEENHSIENNSVLGSLGSLQLTETSELPESERVDNLGNQNDLNYSVIDSKTALHNLEPQIEPCSNKVQNQIAVASSSNAFDDKVEESFSVDDSDQELNKRFISNADSVSQTKPQRPDSLNLLHTTQTLDVSSTSVDSGSLPSIDENKLGKEAPYWVPDTDTTECMHCQMKFNAFIRRRHHCRACGLVLCSKCSDKKASLEYLGFKKERVCHTCHGILERLNNAESESSIMKKPNPNNPMEYCSTIPPPLQVGSTQPPTPSVLVPVVGVLKREGRAKTNDSPKQVIFSDGIRPGGDLTELDGPSEPKLPLRKQNRVTRRVGTPPGNLAVHRRLLNPDTRSFIPTNLDLPPLVVKKQADYTFFELEKPLTVDCEPVKFAINRNLFVNVKRIILDCCVHKDVWCITTEGLSCVGQDEIVFILEVLPDEKHPPKDVFFTVNLLYQEASKGSTITEMSFASPYMNQLFDSKDHGGFVFIRPTYQCIQKLLLPKPPYLIALLIHKWETPWARLFPIRLVLRLGAEYRYYPCPLVSVRNRPALFSEIGHTIFSLLADFRKYSYTLPTVRGLMIHMEDRLTTILLPRNRYDQVMRAINNSEENVLAFAGNISSIADSHLVCIQSTQQDDTSYHTQAINILNKPRQVTGASFIVFNGSLKQPGWSGKSNIVEDGLMVQIPSESMAALRTALRQMNNYTIGCGPQAEEMVILEWAPDDVNFNIGVKSEIDNRPLDGVPSIRVHNGIDYSGSLRLIRWTEVFILQADDESSNRTGDSIDISKLSESIAKATCVALVPSLDLLAAVNLTTLSVRATIHPENVGYEAGSRGEKLPPIYMKSLDEELIAVVHEAAVSIRDVANPIILELIFKVMEQG